MLRPFVRAGAVMFLVVFGVFFVVDRVTIGTNSPMQYAGEGQPKVYDADGDGVAEMLGWFILRPHGRREVELMLVDGKTFEPRWGMRADVVCVAGKNLIGVSGRSVAIADGLTGVERMSAPLSAVASHVCLDGDRVSVRAADDVVTTYDLLTAQPSAAAAVPCEVSAAKAPTCSGEYYPHRAPGSDRNYVITSGMQRRSILTVHSKDGTTLRTF